MPQTSLYTMGQTVSLSSLQFLHTGLSHVDQIICDCRHLVAALGSQGGGEELWSCAIVIKKQNTRKKIPEQSMHIFT